MALYYITIAALLGFGWLACVYRPSKRNLILYLVCAGVLFTLIATMRYSIGYDYFNYKRIYEELAAMSFGEITASPVYIKFIGYAFLNKIIAITGAGYHVQLFIINAALSAGVMWIIYRYSSMPWISTFLYITLQFFAHSMNLVRQSIAATICLLAYRFLRDRKPIPFLLIVAVACTFHLSALFMIPFYFILNWKANYIHYLAVGIPAFLIYLYSTPVAKFVTQYIFTNYAGYINSRYWAGLKWTYSVFPLIYFLAALLFSGKLLRADPKNRVLINSAFYTFLIYFYSTHHMILERFSIYIFFYSLLLIPAMLDTFRVEMPVMDREYFKKYDIEERKQMRQKIYEQGEMKALSICTAVVVCFCYFLFASSQGTNGYHKVYPYVGLWEQTEDYGDEV